MTKIFIIIILSVSVVQAQTGNQKETLKQLNQDTVSAYQSQKFDDALKFAQQALDLTIKIFGTENLQTAGAYKNLSIVYREKKKYKEAIENLRKALEIYQRKPETNEKELANTYENLASTYFFIGKEKDAEENYLKAIEASEKTFGKESKESFPSVTALAIFYARTKNTEKAQDYYLKSYALAIKYFGTNSNELETLRIYEQYYSQQSNLQRSNDPLKEYKKKKFALLGYELGDATSLPRPAYTARGTQGRIVIKVWIDEQGNVTNAKAVYGVMAFSSDCEEAARKAKFKPSYMNGKPISVINYITYNFVS